MIRWVESEAKSPSSDKPYNIAIAEIVHERKTGRIFGKAWSKDEDAIRFIVNWIEQEGMSADNVHALYSERQPSPEWSRWLADNWPHVPVTWSFGPGEDTEMEAAITKLRAKAPKPWWKFW
jgi:hypothetical protein